MLFNASTNAAKCPVSQVGAPRCSVPSTRYFGGGIDIATLLANRGYIVIVASVVPISTNWERACELYRQLTFGQYDSHHLDTLTFLIDVNQIQHNGFDDKYA